MTIIDFEKKKRSTGSHRKTGCDSRYRRQIFSWKGLRAEGAGAGAHGVRVWSGVIPLTSPLGSSGGESNSSTSSNQNPTIWGKWTTKVYMMTQNDGGRWCSCTRIYALNKAIHQYLIL